MGVLRAPFGLQHDAGVEMHGAFGPEARSLALDHDMSGEAAVEIFRHGLADPGVDMAAQRFANVDILAGNAQTHGRFGPSRRRSGSPLTGHLPCVGVRRTDPLATAFLFLRRAPPSSAGRTF